MVARLVTLFAVTIAAIWATIGASHAQGSNPTRAIAVSPAQPAIPAVSDNIVRINAAMDGDKMPFLCRERDSVNLITPIVSRAQDARIRGENDKAQSLMEVAARLQGEICLRPSIDDVVILRCKLDQIDGPGGSVATVKVGAILRSDPTKVEQSFFAWTNASVDESGGGKCPGEAGDSYATSQDILMRVQQRLFDFGHSIPEFDGQPGPETTSALEAFQKANGLPAGGLNKQTIEKLFTTAAPTPWVTFAFDGFGNYAAATGGTRRNAELGAIEQLRRRSSAQHKVQSSAAPGCMGLAVTRFTERYRRSRRTFSQAFTHTGESVDDAWKQAVDYCERESGGGECQIRYVLCANGEDIRNSSLRREDPESRNDRGPAPESRDRRGRDRREGHQDDRNSGPPPEREGRRDGGREGRDGGRDGGGRDGREGRFDRKNIPVNTQNPNAQPLNAAPQSSDFNPPANNGPEQNPGGPIRRFDPKNLPASPQAPR